MEFTRPVVVYLPCYNCEKTVADTLSLIPAPLADRIECLVVDNCSPDRTAEAAAEAARGGTLRFPVRVIRACANLGYPGSQKLAYSLICRSPAVEHAVMLHGDGQYPPEMLAPLVEKAAAGAAVVQGYRSKSAYPAQEETPLGTYLVIKSLNLMESALTGYRRKEWHSGFVMYRTDFLRRVPLHLLSNTMHFDGEMLMCAGVLGLEVAAVPIYKRYKQLETFRGGARRKYVLDVLGVIARFRGGYYRRVLTPPVTHTLPDGFTVVAG